MESEVSRNDAWWVFNRKLQGFQWENEVVIQYICVLLETTKHNKGE